MIVIILMINVPKRFYLNFKPNSAIYTPTPQKKRFFIFSHSSSDTPPTRHDIDNYIKCYPVLSYEKNQFIGNNFSQGSKFC